MELNCVVRLIHSPSPALTLMPGTPEVVSQNRPHGCQKIRVRDAAMGNANLIEAESGRALIESQWGERRTVQHKSLYGV